MSKLEDRKAGILAALADLGGQATASEVSNKTGYMKDLVGKTLRSLESDNLVHRTAGETTFSPAIWSLITDADVDLYDASVEDTDPSQTDSNEINNAGGTPMTTTPEMSTGDAVSDVAAWMGDVRPIPEPIEEEKMAEEVAEKKAKKAKKAEPAEVRRGECTYPKCPSPAMHKEGRSWVHDDVSVAYEHKPTSAVRAVSNVAPGSPHRPRGTMDNDIVAFLQDYPDKAFGAGAIANGLGTPWAGTVGKHCEKLVESGHVLRTASKPGAKYQAA